MDAAQLLKELLENHFYTNSDDRLSWSWREDIALGDLTEDDLKLNYELLEWARENGVTIK